MGKKRKNKKHHSSEGKEDSLPAKSDRMDSSSLPSQSCLVSHGSPGVSSSDNPLWQIQRKFLDGLTENERNNFFDSDAITPERRAELWMAQVELDTVNRFAWATPDDRAMNILRHFAPIVEIGCGSNAYWCQQMKKAAIDVIGYDVAPQTGGTIPPEQTSKKANAVEHRSTAPQSQSDFVVRHGGPEVLKKHANRTLFLCYPDEDDGILLGEHDEPVPLAAACLQHYSGEYVIHVGELFWDLPLSTDQAPWGRSSSNLFQECLASEFHCLLRAKLQNWLHTVDTISVWKRSKTTTIVFADSDSEGSDDEEAEYRHIPLNERLPADIAAPCVQHLLGESSNTKDQRIPNDKIKQTNEANDKQQYQNRPKKKCPKMAPQQQEQQTKNTPIQANIASAEDSGYSCPW
jgi:hypothetical protein